MSDAGLTDPIIELVSALRDLRFSVDAKGYDALAKKFGVESGSSDFALIVSLILKRMESISELIRGMDEVDDTVKDRQITCISNLRRAFSPATLSNNWKANGGGPGMLAEEFLVGVESLQSHARQKQPIPRLTDEEVSELLHETEIFRIFLEELQSEEKDFIRQSIIDGVREFELSLKHFRWVGWAQCFQSFKQTYLTYRILETGDHPNYSSHPRYSEALKSARSLVRRFLDVANRAKTDKEAIEFLTEGVSKFIGGN